MAIVNPTESIHLFQRWMRYFSRQIEGFRNSDGFTVCLAGLQVTVGQRVAGGNPLQPKGRRELRLTCPAMLQLMPPHHLAASCQLSNWVQALPVAGQGRVKAWCCHSRGKLEDPAPPGQWPWATPSHCRAALAFDPLQHTHLGFTPDVSWQNHSFHLR